MLRSNVSRLIGFFVVVLLIAFAPVLPGEAQARTGTWSQSKYAAIVIDANTDRVLFARNADRRRFPASLTKMMTLYMLFAEMQAEGMTLKTKLRVSARATAQAPTKLGLKTGQTISVRTAILALVTKSANDVATVIAEHIGKTESAFAARMTKRARKLGMSNTVFRNASGLPDSGQHTTARDLARLAIALRRDFPEYYHYFKTRSFTYRGRRHANHNRLLGRVKGVDGIKTGYIKSSGFNLATSARRGRRHLVAVVMGGPSARTRDRHMIELLNKQFANASTRKTVASGRVDMPAVAPLPPIRPEIAPQLQLPSAAPAAPQGSESPLKPQLLTAAAPAAPPSVEDPIGAMLAKPRPLEGNGNAQEAEAPRAMITVIPKTPGPVVKRPDRSDTTNVMPTPAPHPRVVPSPKVTRTIAQRLREQWLIQIGAYNDEPAARNRLREALSESETLKNRLAYTEAVQKNESTLYRARFAGFDKRTAEAACKTLQKAKFPCLPMRQ